jgi:serine/threonine protein phosphatase PrpC
MCQNQLDSAVGRSLGDGDFKIPTSEANFVSSEPFTNSLELTKEHSFLLLACDGLFDKLTPQEAIEFVHEQLQEDQELRDVAELLTEYALTKQTTDNVSVVLCQFQWK